MKINKRLIWDYEFTEKDFETETFRRWYVARALTNGTLDDLQGVGQKMIRRYLPQIWLPAAIRHFWEWFFGLPHAQPSKPDTYYFPNRAA